MTPKELVALIADVTDMQEGSVVQHDRNLADAGLRTVGGRGRAVARVTFQDAANLLIATVASRNVKDSAKTVERFSNEATTLAHLMGTGGGTGVTLAETSGDIEFRTLIPQKAIARIAREVSA